jgi:hypothetical protein
LTGSEWGPKVAGSRLAGPGTVSRVSLGLGETVQIYLVRIVLDQNSGFAAGRCRKLVEVPRLQWQKDPCMQLGGSHPRFSPAPLQVRGLMSHAIRIGPLFHVIHPSAQYYVYTVQDRVESRASAPEFDQGVWKSRFQSQRLNQHFVVKT